MNEHSKKFFDNKNHLYINDNILTCMEIEILRLIYIHMLQNENEL